jgi:hypothetical protein
MKRPRARHEIRSFAGAELYGRLLREAAASGMTVSECVRRELEELYAFRDELGDALRIAGGDSTPARGLFDAALKGLEARLAGNFGAQLERLDRVTHDLARLEAMIDRFYLGVMLHLDDVPEALRSARLKRASERHRAWLEAVDAWFRRPRACHPLTDPPSPTTRRRHHLGRAASTRGKLECGRFSESWRAH